MSLVYPSPHFVLIRIMNCYYSLLKFLSVCVRVGGDLTRQNSITQQILAQYLQKRLNRAGGTVQVVGQQQLLQGTGNDLPVVTGPSGIIQKNGAENLYSTAEDDVIGDTHYDQGQT